MKDSIRRPVTVAMAVVASTTGLLACSSEEPSTAPAVSTAVSTQRTVSSPAAPTPTSVLVDSSLNAPLQEAAAADDAARVRDLLARGAQIESRGYLGRTPLVTATKNRAVDAARVLIDAGADVNAKDDIEDSAYLYAGAEGLDTILRMTLDHGADVTAVNRYGGTALIPAAEHGSISTVRMLIEAGVDVNHVNTPVWTALHEAVVYGDGSQRYQDVVTALLDASADPNIRDGQGRTVLANAQSRGQTAIVRILLDRGGAE